MSRVGNSPIAIPEGVNVDIKPNELVVSGKLGSLTQDYDGVSVLSLIHISEPTRP